MRNRCGHLDLTFDGLDGILSDGGVLREGQ